MNVLKTYNLQVPVFGIIKAKVQANSEKDAVEHLIKQVQNYLSQFKPLEAINGN